MSKGRASSKKKCEICENHATIFLNFLSTCDLIDVADSIYERKIVARPFDTIHGIQQSLSLAQALLKGRKAQARTNAFETVGEPRVNPGIPSSRSNIRSNYARTGIFDISP